MNAIENLAANVNERFSELIQHSHIACNELTIEITPQHLLDICLALRDEPAFQFSQLMDVCGVDYLHYGLTAWETESTTETGFERGVTALTPVDADAVKPYRFATVYHLLSLTHNQRLRIRVILDAVKPTVPSVVSIWPSANWFEREAFDLFGIHFAGHPDLRRILTDYGFIGHPFRKDFPLSGNVEVRYDAALKQVIYQPVTIEPRVLEPKVIRRDNRYEVEKKLG